ncbi:helix-turn-helix domain-containing protein [Aliamphritea spongicola]
MHDKTKDRQIFIDGARLKRLRREHGLSQEALADACERQHLRISIATIKRAETNKPVTLRTLHNLAEFFGIPRRIVIAQRAVRSGRRAGTFTEPPECGCCC